MANNDLSSRFRSDMRRLRDNIRAFRTYSDDIVGKFESRIQDIESDYSLLEDSQFQKTEKELKPDYRALSNKVIRLESEMKLENSNAKLNEKNNEENMNSEPQEEAVINNDNNGDEKKSEVTDVTFEKYESTLKKIRESQNEIAELNEQIASLKKELDEHKKKDPRRGLALDAYREKKERIEKDIENKERLLKEKENLYNEGLKSISDVTVELRLLISEQMQNYMVRSSEKEVLEGVTKEEERLNAEIARLEKENPDYESEINLEQYTIGLIYGQLNNGMEKEKAEELFKQAVEATSRIHDLKQKISDNIDSISLNRGFLDEIHTAKENYKIYEDYEADYNILLDYIDIIDIVEEKERKKIEQEEKERLKKEQEEKKGQGGSSSGTEDGDIFKDSEQRKKEEQERLKREQDKKQEQTDFYDTLQNILKTGYADGRTPPKASREGTARNLEFSSKLNDLEKSAEEISGETQEIVKSLVNKLGTIYKKIYDDTNNQKSPKISDDMKKKIEKFLIEVSAKIEDVEWNKNDIRDENGNVVEGSPINAEALKIKEFYKKLTSLISQYLLDKPEEMSKEDNEKYNKYKKGLEDIDGLKDELMSVAPNEEEDIVEDNIEILKDIYGKFGIYSVNHTEELPEEIDSDLNIIIGNISDYASMMDETQKTEFLKKFAGILVNNIGYSKINSYSLNHYSEEEILRDIDEHFPDLPLNDQEKKKEEEPPIKHNDDSESRTFSFSKDELNDYINYKVSIQQALSTDDISPLYKKYEEYCASKNVYNELGVYAYSLSQKSKRNVPSKKNEETVIDKVIKGIKNKVIKGIKNIPNKSFFRKKIDIQNLFDDIQKLSDKAYKKSLEILLDKAYKKQAGEKDEDEKDFDEKDDIYTSKAKIIYAEMNRLSRREKPKYNFTNMMLKKRQEPIAEFYRKLWAARSNNDPQTLYESKIKILDDQISKIQQEIEDANNNSKKPSFDIWHHKGEYYIEGGKFFKVDSSPKPEYRVKTVSYFDILKELQALKIVCEKERDEQQRELEDDAR